MYGHVIYSKVGTSVCFNFTQANWLTLGMYFV